MILTLEEQVSSLESSKRLKELGCPQESLFYWRVLPDGRSSLLNALERKLEELNLGLARLNANDEYDRIWGRDTYLVSAYTVAELGELLPQDLYTYKQIYTGGLNVAKGTHWFGTGREGTIGYNRLEHALKEAEARSKMLIYLLEQGLTEVPNANSD